MPLLEVIQQTHDMAGMAMGAAQNHDMGGMRMSGTFQGHVLPGVLFLFWAAWWTFRLVRSRGAEAYTKGLLERGLFMPVAKVVLPVIGVVGELAPGGWEWRPAMVNNFQHAIMYVGFMVAGVVDLLARAGRVSRSATYLAYVGAAGNAALLFAGHGHMGGLPDTVHQILVYVFAAAIVLALVEIFIPDRGVAWLRVGAVYVLGLWFIEIAWMLYRSGWDMVDHHNQMKAYLFFSATLIGVTAALLALHQLLGAPGPGGRRRAREG
ncbi:MAG: DUF716 domain-containing protein [Longimicrobiales bacterium]|nr:DUF716 domain-containing protein [Longimicrobiales bacterium]